MSRRSKNEILADLQIVLAEKILDRIQNGEDVTAAEWNVARQLLKDNQIESVPGANPALDKIKEAALQLPKFDDDHVSIN